MTEARLIIDASERDSDLFYASRFLAGDPFVYVEIGGRSYLLLSDLEYGRGQQEAQVDEIVSYSDLEKEVSAQLDTNARMDQVVAHFLRQHGANKIEVPHRFPLGYADKLREADFDVTVKNPMFPSRVCKSAWEIEQLAEAQAVTEKSMALAIGLIRNSAVAADGTLMHEGEPLTSELVKHRVTLCLLDDGYTAKEIIVAPGDQGCDPHNRGSGPLRAQESIIIDIFPRNGESLYWGDMTRTVVKGESSSELTRVYDSVKRAQQAAVDAVAPGVTGHDVHKAVQEVFAEDGFETERRDGTWVGFFHGTGHGVGLDIHESPRVSRNGPKLEEGMVVTIEPGLYYPGIGAVRIEDMVVVTADGCRNLNSMPKELCV